MLSGEFRMGVRLSQVHLPVTYSLFGNHHQRSISQMTPLPKRAASIGVGKQIGGAIYVYRLYENLLPNRVGEAKALLPDGFPYKVVKYQTRSEVVSFIVCDDFNTADESSVGDVCTVKPDGSVKVRRASQDPWIYHHKWLFVKDDYTGFNVEQSRARSQQWLALEGVDFRRIGKKSFWAEQVLPRIE